MKRKIWCTLLAVIVIASLFSACTGGGATDGASDGGAATDGGSTDSGSGDAPEPADGQTVVKFLHKWPQPENKPYFDEVIAAFHEANPDILIVDEAIADDPIKDRLRVLMASDEVTDIFFSWSGEFANKFIRAEAVLDLTPYLDENGGEWRNTFMTAGLEPFSMDGRDYGIPLRINSKHFIYHKEIFDEYDLSAPETWDEFLAVCQTLKENGVTPIAFGDQYPWAACHYITGLNNKMVPKEVRDVDYNFKTGEFTHEGYVQALNMFKELNDLGYFNESVNSTSHDMAQQTWAVQAQAIYYVELEEFKQNNENIAPAEWGFFNMPEVTGAAGTPNYLTGAPDGFMVSGKTQVPDEAIRFLKFMTSLEMSEKMVEMLEWPSPVIGAVHEGNSPAYLVEGIKAIEDADGMALWLDTDIHIKVSDVYLPGMQELLNGTVTAEELMEKVQAAAQEVQSLDE